MEFTKEELQVIMKFMERVEMKGVEAIAYMQVMQKLEYMIQGPPKEHMIQTPPKEDCPTCDEEKEEDCPVCEE